MKAVIFVDVQKDFIDGALRNKKAVEVTPKIVEWAKKIVTGCPVYKIYATRDTHQPTTYICPPEKMNPEIKKSFYASGGYLHSLEGRNLPVEHCIEMTDGWMIDNRLMEVIDGAVTIINKPTFGSYDLVEILQEDQRREQFKFDEIILCGFCTDCCISANAILLRAAFPDMKITVMQDLCAGVTDESHAAALKVFKMQQIDIETSAGCIETTV